MSDMSRGVQRRREDTSGIEKKWACKEHAVSIGVRPRIELELTGGRKGPGMSMGSNVGMQGKTQVGGREETGQEGAPGG